MHFDFDLYKKKGCFSNVLMNPKCVCIETNDFVAMRKLMQSIYVNQLK